MSYKKDITGRKFGRLTAIKVTGVNKNSSRVWECLCECGRLTYVGTSQLTGGNTKSCGCLVIDLIRLRRKDMSGKRFGKLTILGVNTNGTKKLSTSWDCLCDCGNIKSILISNLISGHSASCGCSEGYKLSEGESSFNVVMTQYINNAKNRGLCFFLTKDQCREIFSQNCFYCGITPSNICSRKQNHGIFVYNGIDRVNNSLGYTTENCVPCCKTCNVAKHAMSYDDWTAWISRLTQYQTHQNEPDYVY